MSQEEIKNGKAKGTTATPTPATKPPWQPYSRQEPDRNPNKLKVTEEQYAKLTQFYNNKRTPPGDAKPPVTEKEVKKEDCYNCGEKGHFARNCPHPKKPFKTRPDEISTCMEISPIPSAYSGSAETALLS
jgi:hypothetical protein